ARLHGRLDPPADPRGVEWLVGPRVDSTAERRPRIEQPAADEAPAGIYHRDDVAGRDVAHVRHITLEDPWMRPRPLLVALLQPEHRGFLRHGLELTFDGAAGGGRPGAQRR